METMVETWNVQLCPAVRMLACSEIDQKRLEYKQNREKKKQASKSTFIEQNRNVYNDNNDNLNDAPCCNGMNSLQFDNITGTRRLN